jgi:hypothetical protein
MRFGLIVPCTRCARPQQGLPNRTFAFIEYHDSAVYRVACSEGHETVLILQEQKCEVLFQIGAQATIDGYYREAIVSFTASMERFQEFAIRCLLDEAEVAEAVVSEAWRKVLNQTERQLGAFIFLWVDRFKALPPLLRNDDAGFRNAVVHKGRIPTREEAVSYGGRILDVVRPAMRLLKEQLADEIRNAVVAHLHRAQEEAGGADVPTVTMAGGTILSLMHQEEEERPLEESLDGLARYMARMRAMAQRGAV